MVRTLFTGVVLLLASNAAAAQITTYIAPPRAPATSPQMVAAADSALRDSLAQVAMTNMKAWVDSAAGVTVPEHVGDTIPVGDPGRPVTTTFEEGAVAPATASYLPALAVVGVLTFVAGTVLLAKRQR